MSLTFNVGTDTCAKCPSSREGCEARQMFAKGERCCSRCSHDDPADNECSPPNKESVARFFASDKPRTTPGIGVHSGPACVAPFSQPKELTD